MVVALVRQIDTHYLVGFFAAPDLATMSRLVQKGDRPNECEFAEIASGGFFCGNYDRYDVRLPLSEKVDHQPEPFDADWPHSFEVFDAAEPTECLAAAMSSLNLVWRPLEDLGVEHFPSRQCRHDRPTTATVLEFKKRTGASSHRN